MRRETGKAKDQKGMASIFVVMTLMTLLALISIGFSRLMNREVRQSLDRQLSVAAYYAAESGVNDARDYLADGGTKIDGCSPPASDPHFVYSTDGSGKVTPGDISGDGLFRYSCVIVNPTPKELTFTIGAGQSKIVKLSGTSLASLSKLFLSWQNANGYSGTPQPLGAYGQLPQQSGVGSDSTGLLRVGLFPMVNGCNDGALYNRYVSALGANTADAAIECASRNYFLYPNGGSGGTPDCSYSTLSASKGCVRYDRAADNGGVVPGNCNYPAKAPATSISGQSTPLYCFAEMSNLLPVTGSAGTNAAASYYLKLTAEYKPLRVQIQATDSSGTPNSLEISGAEAVIDITATGNDILRRIQAQAPLNNDTPPVNFGLQSMESVCKLFRNDVTGPNTYDNPHLDGNAGAYNTDNKGGANCDWPSGSNVFDPNGLPPINMEPPPSINFYADSYNFDSGGSTTLHWSSTDADSCSGNFSTAGGATSGATGTGSLGAGSYTYTITCLGPSGSDTRSLTITVNNPQPPPTCNDPNAKNYGGSPPCQYWTYYTQKVCLFDDGSYTTNLSNCVPRGGILTDGCWREDGVFQHWGAC